MTAGGSICCGWTDAADCDNASASAAFFMIPRSNRILDGRFNFVGEDFQLEGAQQRWNGPARDCAAARMGCRLCDGDHPATRTGRRVVSGRATKKQKLNSIRLLEAKKIAHEILHYDSGIRDAQLVAAAVGVPAASTYKTLVAQLTSSGKPILVLLPSNMSLNLKRLAKVLGEKKLAPGIARGCRGADRVTGGWNQRIGAAAKALVGVYRPARGRPAGNCDQRRPTWIASVPGDERLDPTLELQDS